MNFKRSLFLLVFGLFIIPCTKAQSTKLLRSPDISKDHITFIYGGDIWLADKNGENPKRLTTFPGEELFPHFSPDGETIAFSGKYDGNTDVYVVSVYGGPPKRLTWHPANDHVVGWTPQGQIMFTSGREQVPIPMPDLLYTIDRNGGMPTLFMKPRFYNGQLSPDGKYLAYRKNIPWETEWRNYRGGQANPIRILNLETFKVEKIPWEGSNDISPVWINETIYFLSDMDFAMNIWAYNTLSKELKQITFYKEFDCKNLEAGNHEMIYEYGGDLYTLSPERNPQRLTVNIKADFPWMRPHWADVEKFITQMEISPTGKRAIIEARGEIFTLPEKEGNVRNLTSSSGSAERSPAWSPNGEKVSWFSDQSGEYQLIIANQFGKILKKITFEKPTFYYTPQWSPDSKFISFSDTDRVLWMVNIETGTVTRIDDEGFSNPERVIVPQWSPDSKWIAYAKRLPNEFSAIFLYSLDKNQSFQITDGMSECRHPAWDKGGKFLYFMASTNYGLNTGWLDMSSLERPVDYSLYVTVLDQEEKSPLLPRSDDEETDQADPKKKKEKIEVKIDLEGIQQRILSLDIPARDYRKLLTAEEGVIFYSESVEDQRGLTLHRYSLDKQETKNVLENVSDFTISFDGKKILYSSNGNWYITATSENIKPDQPLQTSALKIKVDPMAEYKQMFREAWRFQRDYFYVKNVHGLAMDWAYNTYSTWVDHVRHRSDMNYLLDIFSGETAVGHSFVNGGDFPDIDQVPVGLLGADLVIENNAVRFTKIYKGESWNPTVRAPLNEPGLEVKEGDYLLAVNGEPVNPAKNIYSYFEQTANKQIKITVNSSTDLKTAREITVVPVESEYRLRQIDWVEGNRRKVDELSDGKLAYVWLPNTGYGGYSNFNRYYFAQKHKKGAVIDERFNGGGLAADYIIDLLDRELMGYFNNPMGDKTSQTSPAAGLWGPKAMIINEFAQSTGDNSTNGIIDRYGSGEDYNFKIFENIGGDLRLVTKIYGNKGGRTYNGHIVLKPGTTEAFKDFYYNAPDHFFENPENHQNLVNSVDFLYGGTSEFWWGEVARMVFGSAIEFYWGGAMNGATTGPVFPGGDVIIY
ncbi:MAG: PDZ domain-containing protein [Bacteroidales bacterium]|jgi:tricorn protease|nr:PDZ domain-containing protein [Bacteroidales bacterium]